MTPILSQIEGVARLIEADNKTIETKHAEWKSACSAGAMDVAVACEKAIDDAERNVSRLMLRQQALEQQAGTERAAATVAANQQLMDNALKLETQFLAQLAAVAAQVAATTDATYQLSLLGEKLATARMQAQKAGVVWTTAFKPKPQLQQMQVHAQRLYGNCENLLLTDYSSPAG